MAACSNLANAMHFSDSDSDSGSGSGSLRGWQCHGCLENEILQVFPKELLEHYRTQKRGKIYVRFSNRKYKRVRFSHQEPKRRRVAENRDRVYATEP
ncbi:GL18873 [Drosophila persimilis]|uniref:GL18873 n=1 Tax=Drosophila persimilis TaxID=7234 RepID=B4G8A9_DROPE|nr:GL18873 [Drosophila persimilis]